MKELSQSAIMHPTLRFFFAASLAVLPLAVQAQSTYVPQPGYTQPSYGQPGYVQPGYGQNPGSQITPQQKSILENDRNQEKQLRSQLDAAKASGNTQQEQAIRSQMEGVRNQAMNSLSPAERQQLEQRRQERRQQRGSGRRPY